MKTRKIKTTEKDERRRENRDSIPHCNLISMPLSISSLSLYCTEMMKNQIETRNDKQTKTE